MSHHIEVNGAFFVGLAAIVWGLLNNDWTALDHSYWNGVSLGLGFGFVVCSLPKITKTPQNSQ